MKTLISQNKDIVVYAALMVGLGVWQLLDWHYGAEDPIWHLLFYLLIMPFFSLIFGLFAGARRKPWRVPLLSGAMVVFVYVFMANGGISLDAVSFLDGLKLSVLSAFTASLGVIVRRIARQWNLTP